MSSRSEHDLSDTEDSQPLGARQRLTRGVFNDHNQTSRTPGGWSRVKSTLSYWSSSIMTVLKSFDWKGNGHLVTSSPR
jgi:hypothetical protein